MGDLCIMFDFKWLTGFVLICICGIRFGLANNLQTDFKLGYNNSLPDAIKFSVTSEHDRYHINHVECGTSIFHAASSDRTALITGLKSCKLYECTVEIKNKFSLEKFVLIERVTTGFHSEACPIKLVKIVPESNSIRIELDFQQIDCIDSFYVVLDNSRAILWTKFNLTKTLIVSELSPCVKYHMYILFNHFFGPHTILTNYVQTVAPKLNRIEKIEFNPQTDLLTWNSVLFDDCTSNYAIVVQSQTSDETLFFESALNEYNLNFLGGCSKYFIRVKPKAHDNLFGTATIETGFKIPRGSVQNVHVNLLNISALSIEWSRPTGNSACNIDYAIQVNGVWTITTSLEYIVPVCNSTLYYNISLCIVGLRTAINCVNYSFDVNLNKLIGPGKQSSDYFMHIPPLYRFNSWGSITMYNFNDTEALLHINHTVTSLSNSKFILAISELKCGRNLVQSYKIFETHNVDDKCTYLEIESDSCTKVCEFKKIPDELEINIIEGTSFRCDSADQYRIALKRGVTYEIMARIFTPIGYTDTTPIVYPKDRILANKLNLFWYITIPVVSTVLLIILVAIGLFCKNRSQPADRTFIEVQYLSSFYRKIDSNYIQHEFQAINNIDFGHLSKTVPDNEMVGKNRYENVIPYDYNRVIISTGYINASYIDGYRREKQYIATQGPTEETVSDFWHMIVEQKCDGIVMLTDLSENGTDLCCQYYPDINETDTINDITIKNVEETDYGQFIKRILQVTQGKVKRFLVQYQYVHWHNGNCPEDGLDLVEFVENTGCLNSESSDPILVHSSAGIGRTGTFIALDLLIQHLRAEKYISIFDTVKKLRSQRCRMVETIGQYVFLYDCVNMYYLTRIQKRRSDQV